VFERVLRNATRPITELLWGPPACNGFPGGAQKSVTGAWHPQQIRYEPLGDSEFCSRRPDLRAIPPLGDSSPARVVGDSSPKQARGAAGGAIVIKSTPCLPEAEKKSGPGAQVCVKSSRPQRSKHGHRYAPQPLQAAIPRIPGPPGLSSDGGGR
jgi:hypothetical protein